MQFLKPFYHASIARRSFPLRNLVCGGKDLGRGVAVREAWDDGGGSGGGSGGGGVVVGGDVVGVWVERTGGGGALGEVDAGGEGV